MKHRGHQFLRGQSSRLDASRRPSSESQAPLNFIKATRTDVPSVGETIIIAIRVTVKSLRNIPRGVIYSATEFISSGRRVIRQFCPQPWKFLKRFMARPLLSTPFVTGQDAGIVLSPLIGVVVGALVTLVLIILVVVVRVRRERVSKPRHEKPAELSELPPQQYPLQNPQQTVETDPDVIPNKFEGNLVEVSPPSYPGGYPPGHWVTPGPTPSIDELCHKFAGRPTELRLPSRSTIPSLQSMPMTGVMVGAGQGVVVSAGQAGVVLGGSQGVVVGGGQGVVVAGECLDGEAIKRRLMANRLPESCV